VTSTQVFGGDPLGVWALEVGREFGPGREFGGISIKGMLFLNTKTEIDLISLVPSLT